MPSVPRKRYWSVPSDGTCTRPVNLESYADGLADDEMGAVFRQAPEPAGPDGPGVVVFDLDVAVVGWVVVAAALPDGVVAGLEVLVPFPDVVLDGLEGVVERAVGPGLGLLLLIPFHEVRALLGGDRVRLLGVPGGVPVAGTAAFVPLDLEVETVALVHGVDVGRGVLVVEAPELELVVLALTVRLGPGGAAMNIPAMVASITAATSHVLQWLLMQWLLMLLTLIHPPVFLPDMCGPRGTGVAIHIAGYHAHCPLTA